MRVRGSVPPRETPFRPPSATEAARRMRQGEIRPRSAVPVAVDEAERLTGGGADVGGLGFVAGGAVERRDGAARRLADAAQRQGGLGAQQRLDRAIRQEL